MSAIYQFLNVAKTKSETIYSCVRLHRRQHSQAHLVMPLCETNYTTRSQCVAPLCLLRFSLPPRSLVSMYAHLHALTNPRCFHLHSLRLFDRLSCEMHLVTSPPLSKRAIVAPSLRNGLVPPTSSRSRACSPAPGRQPCSLAVKVREKPTHQRVTGRFRPRGCTKPLMNTMGLIATQHAARRSTCARRRRRQYAPWRVSWRSTDLLRSDHSFARPTLTLILSRLRWPWLWHSVACACGRSTL